MEEDDLTTPGKRLRWARTRAGYKSSKDAARASKAKEVSFRAYENDQHGYSRHAVKFARAFGVSVEWLLNGGTTPDNDPPRPGDLSTPVALVEDYGIELVRKVDIAYAMGDGAVIEDYPETDFVPFSLNFLRNFTRATTDKLFIATAIGDSMEPTLRRDDLVMIDTAQNGIALQDQIWALSYAGVGMIKRVRRLTGGRVHLLSDNPAVPPLEARDDEVYIVGKVVWTARVM